MFFFHVDVASHTHLFKPPKESSHFNPLLPQVKGASKDTIEYANVSNAQNASLLRFSNAHKSHRQKSFEKL
jgi:hypothetical protein